MQSRPQRNPQAWGLKLKELREKVGTKRGVKLSQAALAQEFSELSARLTEQESADLQKLGAVTFLGLGGETISRYESGERSPDLSYILFMIYYFKTQRVIELEVANQWLAVAGEAALYPDESRFLFSEVRPAADVPSAAEEMIQIRKRPDGSFLIPNEYIPEHSGYAIFKDKQGLALKLIILALLVIGVAITSMYGTALVERLKNLLPQPTRFQLTPQPSIVPTLTPNASESYNQGRAYLTQKKWPEAIAAFTQALVLKPDYTDAYYNRGFAYAMTEQWSEAIRDLNQYIQLKPGNVSAYYDLGRAHNGLKQWDKAIADFTKYIQFNPDNPSSYYGRGIAYINTSRWDEAIADFTKHLQFNPDYADSYYNRGRAYAKQKKWSEAAADLTKAIELNPNFAANYYNLGVVREAQGQLREAIADYRHYLQLAPDASSRAQLEQQITELEAKVAQQK